MRARMVRAAALAVLLLTAGPARADEVVLKDGRRLEGKVLEDGPGGVKLRLRFGGDVSFRRDEVERVERKDLPEDALAAKRRALAAGDAAGRWALALEAKRLSLRRACDELRAEVLGIDPGHREANEADGNVEWDGRWVKPAERDRLAAESERAAKAASGLVEWEGKWVTPEEKEAREQGLVLHDGRWMSEAEARRAQGLVPYRGGWVKKEEMEARALQDTMTDASGAPLTAAVTPRFAVFTIFPQEETQRIALEAEKAYAEFGRIFGVKDTDRLFDDPFTAGPRERRCSIVILEKDLQYQKFIDGFLRFHPEAKKALRPERIELMKRQKGFYIVDPDCWIVGFQFPYPIEQMRSTVVHKLSHVLLWRWRFSGKLPGWWLVEGLGEFQEVNAFGRCDTFCITTGYGDPAPGEKWVGDSWKATAKRMVNGGGDRRLADIVVKDLNDLEPHDLVKCWSVVHYLVALDREKFVRLVTVLREGARAAEAFPRVYDATVEEMDARWREFVKRSY